ncbi:hypothetical protein HBI80_188130 [Parastagonospora nodorum]|nr:hypothetical protein HBI80_188130 [Parastagonospora nodorum]KAH4918618.1 hypothetical protein HBI79_208510 [Parastagonospora nodorum]KAH4989601.1 hypothetical protein HBI76_071730 [Parastagonospora nodorum]KAH5010117.1 hypothetical protein HBI75_206650 [Parastagonospora nodorum]KAH5294156.1 hypothetical protein HBI12_224110 [Parastagonospora nodorum]
MATGFDALIDFLLSEIALCGTQGASSADFQRFVQKYYSGDTTSSPRNGYAQGPSQSVLGRTFSEKLWQWVTTHSDIRVIHNSQARHYSLTDFIAAERADGDETSLESDDILAFTSPVPQKVSPAQPLLALRAALQQRLSAEGQDAKRQNSSSPPFIHSTLPQREGEMDKQAALVSHVAVRSQPRNTAKSCYFDAAVFDEPTSSTSAPRLFASQNRIWQALTGHSMDLKKVPTMEFALLSLIAAHGPDGITQPDLVHFSGQDKRSVPHRTDELARKGYIVKNPVQAGKARTSLCVHTKFVSQNHFTTSGAVEDAFRPGTFVASSFVPLLYNSFKDAGVVLTRDLRKRMGVPLATWNKRAVHGALIRLDQSGMIRRFQIRKQKSRDLWVTCIQIQREPRPEDLENLGFRRQAPIADTTGEQLQEDDDGETFMRDLEVDMLEDDEDNDGNNQLDGVTRIPPQWTPDRLLSNTFFEFTALGQTSGWDALVLRDRVVGPYWRRPMESHLTRLTDDWERMQPPHLRHLAIIRDTRTSDEKRFVHYVYRTYRHFQQAVRAGEAAWGGVCKPSHKSDGKSGQKKSVNEVTKLDSWGFHGANQKDFVRFNGTATLSDVRSAIAAPRKYGTRWDIPLAKDIGYDRANVATPKIVAKTRPKNVSTGTESLERPLTGDKNHDAEGTEEADDSDEQPPTLSVFRRPKNGKTKRKGSGLVLTPEERVSLGLKPSGRLSKSAANQILAHRRETGDPNSLPDKLVDEPVIRAKAPLMTREERIAENLPLKGRLGLDKENEIREKRGLPKLVEKVRKKRGTKEPTVLTKQQRIMLGFKDHGRLHQWFIDDLRREQENDVPLEESPAVKRYREFLRGDDVKAGTDLVPANHPGQTTPPKGQTPVATKEAQHDMSEVVGQTPQVVTTPGKRKASVLSTTSAKRKRVHTKSNLSRDNAGTTVTSQQADAQHLNNPQLPNESLIEGAVASMEELQPSNHSTPSRQGPALVAQGVGHPAKPVPVPRSTDDSHERQERSLPGLYLYPSAKRKVLRGRPRNAFLAILQTSRLVELPFFTKEQTGGHEPTNIILLGPCRSAPGSGLHICFNKPEASSSSSSCARLPPQSANSLELKETSTAILPGSPARSREEGEGPENLEEQGQDGLYNIDSQARAPSQLFQPPEIAPDMQQEYRAVTPGDELPSTVGPKVNGEKLKPCVVAGWNSLNASTQVTRPSYQSPYAQSYTPASTQQVAAADITRLPTMRMETPDLDLQSSTELPQGVVGQVLEEEDAEIAAFRKAQAKSAAPTAVGSALQFRREIILEIIDRCNGVFPLHGEIGRPFRAMWNLRHGHTSLRVPENSTVHDTLKNMISNPAFGLKRMAFQVKARNAAGRKLRAIVARSNIAPSDPRVMRLAYNMANHSTEKANQFFPEEIRDIFEYETLYIPPPVAPKDESFTLAQLYPEIETSIQENKIRRRKEIAAQKKAEKAAAKKQNKQVEEVMPKRRARAQEQNDPAQNSVREKRTRLASLNDKNKRYRRAPVQVGILEDMEEAASHSEMREPSPTGTDSSDDVPLMTLRPGRVSPILEEITSGDEDAPLRSLEKSDTKILGGFPSFVANMEAVSFTDPIIRLHATTGTYATDFSLIKLSDRLAHINIREATIPEASAEQTISSPTAAILNPLVNFHATTGTFSTFFALFIPDPKSGLITAAKRTPKSSINPKKRVRIHEPASERPGKRLRKPHVSQKEVLDDEFVYSSTEDSDATSSEDEEEEPRPKQKQKQKTRGSVSKRQLGKALPTPTLLERLTGLTGDPNDPIYKDPKARSGPGSGRPWPERKRKQFNQQRKEREYVETLDHADRFKKLSLTLALASSLSNEEGVVDWSIVEKVYARDRLFDLPKAKKLWAWMQAHMSTQLSELLQMLQTNFLEAYEAGRLPAIEDPVTYDWAGLVRWTMRTCAYSEPPLPLYRETIEQFAVDESNYSTMDRVTWYSKRLADTGRTQLQLQLPFVVPIHGPSAQLRSATGSQTKARSWIRANIATPQPIYDAHLAHEKLETMGEGILSSVVGDFVQHEHLKMRKLKRQLPGRNYTFTKKFAKNYKRPFELEDFMVAATVKKELDTAFASEDPKKRFYSISRCEEDGSIMAIMSLVADGKVKLVPQLPPVDNEFGAPLPRLSKWGFCEGDYVHRSIDRNRMFWDTRVVPTLDYTFGNPFQPIPSPAEDWPSLPEPPLPGCHDDDALLPIWSSIDGKRVTWPWWYRILNLVLQPLYLQPGARAADLYSHCPEHTTELFEVQLVLDWLQSIDAVSKTVGDGYRVSLNFWAAFGDVLLDTRDDIFGQHVKRHTKMTTKQQWRDKYNLRYSKMQAQRFQGGIQQSNGQAERLDATMSERIIHNSKAQYRIIQQAMLNPPSEFQAETAENEQAVEPQVKDMADVQASTACNSEQLFTPHMLEDAYPPAADVEMAEAGERGQEEDAEGEQDDVDAEGEVDDDMY